MNNREAFEAACELLPDGVTWGEPITPSIAKHIAALASQAQQESNTYMEDVQSLVDSSEIMLKWCVKNVQQWNFSEYDWLHRATEKVKASLPPAPEVNHD